MQQAKNKRNTRNKLNVTYAINQMSPRMHATTQLLIMQ